MNELERLVSDLVAINSVNPDLAAQAPGEAEIASYLARWLTQAGLEVQVEEALPHRSNVVGIARGTGGGRSLLFNGHLDTVGAGTMSEPFGPQIQNGRLYGRGAYDMKGGLAACLLAVAAAKHHPLRGDVIFAGVVDEEYAGRGTLALAQRYSADGAIVAEPTELQLIVAHKGYVWLEVETQGVAAHGSRPDLGIDAIAKMGRVLTELEQLDQQLRAGPQHPRLGSGSLHASVIKGGREPSTYSERCWLTVERRTLPGETPDRVAAEIQTILDRLSHADAQFRAVVRRGLEGAPLETPEEAAIVQAVGHAGAGVLHRPLTLAGVPYWTDAATLWAAGIPSVLLGPGGAGAHAQEEWVDLPSVQTCADIYLATALEFCR
jgi:acetylornithine deacetylase